MTQQWTTTSLSLTPSISESKFFALVWRMHFDTRVLSLCYVLHVGWAPFGCVPTVLI